MYINYKGHYHAKQTITISFIILSVWSPLGIVYLKKHFLLHEDPFIGSKYE